MLSQLRNAGKCLDFWKINHIQEVFQQAVIIVTMSMMVMVARGKHLRRLLLRVLLEQAHRAKQRSWEEDGQLGDVRNIDDATSAPAAAVQYFWLR